MQTVLDPATGKFWAAEVYARTDPQRRPAALTCAGEGADGRCEAVAYFRRASIDGRRPCFFSREHLSDCNLGSIASDDDEDGASRPTAAIASTISWVAINLEPPEPSRGPDGRRQPTDDSSQPGASRHTVAAGVATSEATLRPRLRTVLATLCGRGYPAGATVRLDGFPQLPVEQFFVQLDGVDATAMSGLKRGYHGRVRSARVDPGDGSWFIRAHGSDISIVVGAQALSGLRPAAADPTTLVDGPILVLGHPRPSQRSPGRFYLKVVNPTLLEIQPPPRPDVAARAARN